MGFNWKGDVHLPFFKNGTKKELIDYVCCNLKDEFEIINIGIAEKCRKKITYRYLGDYRSPPFDLVVKEQVWESCQLDPEQVAAE